MLVTGVRSSTPTVSAGAVDVSVEAASVPWRLFVTVAVAVFSDELGSDDFVTGTGGRFGARCAASARVRGAGRMTCLRLGRDVHSAPAPVWSGFGLRLRSRPLGTPIARESMRKLLASALVNCRAFGLHQADAAETRLAVAAT